MFKTKANCPVNFILVYLHIEKVHIETISLLRYSTETEETESELAAIPESKSDSTAQGSSQVRQQLLYSLLPSNHQNPKYSRLSIIRRVWVIFSVIAKG